MRMCRRWQLTSGPWVTQSIDARVQIISSGKQSILMILDCVNSSSPSCPISVAAQTGTSLRMIERSYFKFIRSAMLEKLAGLKAKPAGE